MQRRLGRFLPIVMLAMLVQFFAPISASWAFASAASDPLHLAGICSSASDTANDAGTNPHQTANLCCTLCYVAQTAAPTADPQSPFVILQRDARTVVWRDVHPDVWASVAHAYAQARAPPALS
ncbi:MAG: DUF2946 family protein [Xanthobacteraceae bacterium]